MLGSYDAWVFARLACGEPCEEWIEGTHPRLKPLVQYVATIDPHCRPAALGAFMASQAERRDAMYKAVADADPLAPPPPQAVVRPACVLDLGQAAEGLQWAWPGWIPRGRVSGVGGFEGSSHMNP